jgi:hypothetical protein
MSIKISEIEEVFKEIFREEDGVVKSVDTLYEKPGDEDEFLKLVISIHGLSTEDSNIIHTKFIFKTDIGKHEIIDKSFIYLYDINCVYHKVEFDNTIDLKEKIEGILDTNNFGEDIIILSDFIEAPAMFLNYYLKRSNISQYSIFDVEYEPKFKTTPCKDTTFDFKININNNYNVELSIFKIDREDDDDVDHYKFQFRFMDEIETFETDDLKNIHYFIGSHLAKMLDEKLKNNEKD